MGNVTRDLELRYTPNGSAVCDMSLAINRRFGGEGQEREEVTFVDIVIWNKQAETCSRYLSKGSPCLVEGRLQLDAWDDRETGKKRQRLRVVAERVQFLGGRNESTNGHDAGYQQPQVQGGFNQASAPQQPYQAQQAPTMPQAPAPQQPVQQVSVPQQPAFGQPPAAPQQPMAQPQAAPQQPMTQPQAAPQQPPAMPDAFNVDSSVEDDIPF